MAGSGDTRGLTTHLEAQRVVEAMLREEEKFKQNKLLAERVLAQQAQVGSKDFKAPGLRQIAGPNASQPPLLTSWEVQERPSQDGNESAALRRRVSSLEECNGVLQHRVEQLEAAVAVLARLVEHPLVQQALDGDGGNLASGDQPPMAGDGGGSQQEDEEADGEEAEEEHHRAFKRSRSGKVDIPSSKKKWYELVALIKEMKPNNGYPIRSVILAAIDSAKADPLYASSNIPERLERSLDNYCRKSAGPTKRAALQVLDSVWQFVQQPLGPALEKGP